MRCGRCAETLPDETMSFCPACGVLFSRVSPTVDYETFREHDRRVEATYHRYKVAGVSLLAFAAFWALAIGLNTWHNELEIRALHTQRTLEIYTYNLPEFPALSASARRAGIAVALQAFADHFGASLPRVNIHENELPAPLRTLQARGWDPEFSKLSFWEKKLIFDFGKSSGTSLNEALPVIVTNFPLYADGDSGSGMETRHLSKSHIISGLGSPGFVWVSTYRMLAEQPDVAAARPVLNNDSDRARYLGEYLMAHELGHALLGLNDFVTDSTPLRGPASLRAAAASKLNTNHCLMHTDAGGGQRAWEQLKLRTLGQPSNCHFYDSSIAAQSERAQAVVLLQNGKRPDAERLHAQVLKQLQREGNPWLAELTRREHGVFLSAWQRWWFSLFVFESKHDQL